MKNNQNSLLSMDLQVYIQDELNYDANLTSSKLMSFSYFKKEHTYKT